MTELKITPKIVIKSKGIEKDFTLIQVAAYEINAPNDLLIEWTEFFSSYFNLIIQLRF